MKFTLTKTMLAIGVALAVVASSLGLMMPAVAEPAPVSLEELELMTGSTDRFGGGDFVALNIRDARFAVHYGNETNPNGIRIGSEITRYVGGADIYRQNGDLVRSGALPVRTLLAQELLFLVEFEAPVNATPIEPLPDLGGVPGGMLPPPPPQEEGPKPVKALSLNLSWTISEITEGEDENGNRTWDFSLSAYDVPYTRIFLDDGTWSLATEDEGVVEEISFIFHITASEVTFDVDVPWMKIRMEEQKGRMGRDMMGGPRMAQNVEVERAGNRTFNGTTITADIKYDHYIKGWDFESYDNILALETHAIMGNGWHEKAPDMIRNRYEHRVGEGTHMKMEDGLGPNRTDMSEPIQKRELHRNRIEFGDDWQRVGRFGWVEEVEITRDGNTTIEQMRFQVHGGEKIIKHGFDGKMYNGFSLKAAFLYPAGDEIFHDPGLTTDALFMDIGSVNEAVTPSGMLFQVVVAVAAVSMVVGYRLYSKNNKPGSDE